jgi:hypothetical protein
VRERRRPDAGGDQVADEPDGDGPAWRPWVRRLPVPARWGLVLVALLAVTAVFQFVPLREWLDAEPTAARLLAGALGLTGLVIGLGPRRWVEAEARRARGDLRPTVRALGKLPHGARRAFFVGAGVLILAVAVFS